MRTHPSPPCYHGLLPDCFDWSLLTGLLDALPRPVDGEARLLGRAMINRALSTVRLYQPTDAVEAQIVQQIAILSIRIPQVQATALRQGSADGMLRLEAHATRLHRTIRDLEARLRRHRREREMLGQEPEPGGVWQYELDALERHWRGEAPLLVDRVPLWMQAGRQFADELTAEEYEELVFAEQRGEMMPLPPGRPAGQDVPTAPPPAPPPEPVQAAA
jgi:hypothetical protein